MSGICVDGVFCKAETTHGWIEGIVSAGVCQFKAVPYGADTGGRDRFRPPVPPASWSGVRPCFGYGMVSPQVPSDPGSAYVQLIQYEQAVAEGGMGEDCLKLNIWAPEAPGPKRPVMVSIHGGGFAISSGNARIYDGTQLARRGEVVVVTITHRLAAFGHLNLADLGGGEDYSGSGAAGLLDIVLALKWVRDNISAFGGDPGRVTLIGQSGGGWKICALLAMPVAHGLFHRAGVLSGSLPRLLNREDTAKAAAGLLAELDLSRATLARLQELPWQTLLNAQTKLGAMWFQPFVDGRFLPAHPCDPQALEQSRGVPLIVSTTLDDAGLFFSNFTLTEEGLSELLAAAYGDAAAQILSLYRARWPHKSPYLLHAQIITDSGFRRFAYEQVERTFERGGAPVYLYQWNWTTPAFDGRFGATHASDVAASFGNHRDAIIGAGSAAGARLCKAAMAMWTQFATTGDPNTPELPHWPEFDKNRRAALIFDTELRIVDDPDQDVRLFWKNMPPAQSVFG